MKDLLRAVAAAAVLVVAASSAFAHGGGMVIPRNRDRSRATGDVPPSPPPPPPPSPAETGGDAKGPTTVTEEDPATRDTWFAWWTTQRRAFQRSRGDGGAARTADEQRTAAAVDPVEAALIRGAHDRDDDVATGSLVALGRLGNPAHVALLCGVLTDPARPDTQREAAACGLAFLGVPPAGRAGPVRASEALAQTVTDAKAPSRLRGIAAYALGLRAEPESRDVLVAAVLSPATPPAVAAAAAASIGLIGGDESEAVLVDLLARGRTDADPGLIRAHAAQGLARCGGPRAVEALVQATEDKDADVRRAALFALGAVARPEDESALKAFRKRIDQDPDMGCRDAAILGMGRQGAPAAKKTIDDAVAGGRRVHASYALTALGFWSRRAGDPRAAAPIRAALASGKTPAERAAACFALGLARDKGARPVVVRIAEGGAEGNVRAVAASVVADLVADGAASDETVLVLRRLTGPSEPSDVRREAAIALGTIGDAAAAKDLLRIVESSDGNFERAAAVSALGRIGGAGVATELTAILAAEDRPPYLRALSAVGLGLLRERAAVRPLWLVGADLDITFAGEAVAEMLTIL